MSKKKSVTALPMHVATAIVRQKMYGKEKEPVTLSSEKTGPASWSGWTTVPTTDSRRWTGPKYGCGPQTDDGTWTGTGKGWQTGPVDGYSLQTGDRAGNGTRYGWQTDPVYGYSLQTGDRFGNGTRNG